MTRGWSASLLLGATAATVGAFALAARAPALDARLLLDGTSRFFLPLVQVLFLGISLHAIRSGSTAQDAIVRRLVLFGLPFLAGCDLAILASSPALAWAGLELSTLFGALLVVSGSRERTAGALQYFLFSSVGLGFVLLGFSYLEHAAGHALGYRELLADPPSVGPWAAVGVFLVTAGFGTKLGWFPLNTWVPTTYATAPAPVAALLGAVQFNATLVGLLRLVEAYHAALPGLLQPLLLASGVATMAVSTLGIVTTRDYLRLLGYASVNHAGVIAIGLGLGGPAAYGVLVYATSNAFVKALLFLSAGRVLDTFHTTDAREVRGLVKLLPYNGLLLMVGTFALLGLPPFGSFLGELLILSAVVESGRTWLLLPLCGLLVISFMATGRTLFPMIWGQPADGAARRPEPTGVVVPKLVFLGALVLLGLYVPAPVNDLLRDVAATLSAP